MSGLHLGPDREPQCGHNAMGTHSAFPTCCAHFVIQFVGPYLGTVIASAWRRCNIAQCCISVSSRLLRLVIYFPVDSEPTNKDAT